MAEDDVKGKPVGDCHWMVSVLSVTFTALTRLIQLKFINHNRTFIPYCGGKDDTEVVAHLMVTMSSGICVPAMTNVMKKSMIMNGRSVAHSPRQMPLDADTVVIVTPDSNCRPRSCTMHAQFE